MLSVTGNCREGTMMKPACAPASVVSGHYCSLFRIDSRTEVHYRCDTSSIYREGISVWTGAASGAGAASLSSLLTAAIELPTFPTACCKSSADMPSRFFRHRTWLGSARSILFRTVRGMERSILDASLGVGKLHPKMICSCNASTRAPKEPAHGVHAEAAISSDTLGNWAANSLLATSRCRAVR